MDAYSITRFDACIDIPDTMVPTGMTPQRAIDLVSRAVEAMPGAGWISVDYAGRVPPNLPWLILYGEQCAYPMFGGAWDALTERVRARMREVLAGI